MQRKFKICLLLAALAVVWSGCDSDEDDISSLDVISATVDFQATGGEGIIRLQTTGEEITVQADKTDWCSVKEVGASQVTFDVKENYGITSRNTTLTVYCGAVSKTFHINQAGAVLGYLDNEWILRTSNDAAELPFTLYASFDIKVEIPAEAKSWLSFSKDDDARQGKFIVKENTSGGMRAANINVVSGERSVRYQVIQYDVDDMLGLWNGQFNDLEAAYALENVDIQKQADGTYTLSNILTDAPCVLRGYASENCLAFPAGQNTGFDSGLYFFFQLVDADGYFVSSPSQTISLGPVMQSDGSYVLAFGGVKDTDPLAFALRMYEDENMEIPYESLFVPTVYYYINCILYK